MDKVADICKKIIERIEEKNVHVFSGMEKPLFLISEVYIGVWLEHVYDAVTYALLFPDKGKELAKNTIETFIKYQKNGQYPCYIWDKNYLKNGSEDNIGYSQMQECVSFGSLCLLYCETFADRALLSKVYISLQKWIEWQRKYRMTRRTGLVEMFVGYDSGHDNSGRLDGMRYRENHRVFGKEKSAKKYPTFCKVAPVLAVDVNACYYGNLRALAKAARTLGRPKEAEEWERQAEFVKCRLFEYCYNEEDAFFYDVDRRGKQRKYLSCSILSLFQEGVLDAEEDTAAEEILRRHVLNPNEFFTPYPFPSMAINDPSAKTHRPSNDWGYFTQGNTALRTTLWMDRYGRKEEQNAVAAAWVEGWTRAFETMPLGQELDPVTGEPSPSSPWYSTGMLFYLWAAKRLHLAEGVL